ncbi:MAG TPA: YMGG-like glycine zipper-containing protein [Nitrospirota bacterium]|nr:YMGG-like glycine zipper-containing protein [Nitrospirota bacterium]
MRTYKQNILISFVVLVVGGCATMPTGPSVMVMPPPGKPFDVFQAEDITCRQWARQQIGLSPQDTLNQNTATGAVIGTGLGAALGAAIGAASASSGAGAAIGAASGLLVGTMAGANAGQVSGWEAQRRYDIAYQQCMYANGNMVPAVRQYYRVQRMPPPPPPASMESAPPDTSQPHVAPPSPPAQ